MGDDDRDRGLTRRRALQGLGAFFGATALGCGSDGAEAAAGTGSASGDGSDESTRGETTSGSTSSSSASGSGSEDSSGEGSSTGEPADACSDPSGLAPEELLAEIDTIVVVMMENRSFDHYFGSAMFLEKWPIAGLTGRETNPNSAGDAIKVFELQNLEPLDPPHEWDDAHFQWNLGENNGFVLRHETVTTAFAAEVMGYHTRAQLPILYTLGENYSLCDQWFSSVMGPTWPNRFHLHSASSGGAQNNFPEPSLAHIYDVLGDAGVSGRNYYSDIAWMAGGYLEPGGDYLAPLDAFFDQAASGTLPNYSVIDPNFGILGGGGNDDHPPHSLVLGQVFLGAIYAALAASPQWNRCLLVITYDEHGGFYDHVNPPTTSDPQPDFAQLGFRVPSVVIGPQVRRGCVNSEQFDHVSVLSTLHKRFGVQALNGRMVSTPDLSSCIDGELLGNPQPPVRLPQMTVSLADMLTAREGHGQPELKAMLDRGDIPLPPEHRRVDPGRELKLRLLDHAQRLGVVKLMP